MNKKNSKSVDRRLDNLNSNAFARLQKDIAKTSAMADILKGISTHSFIEEITKSYERSRVNGLEEFIRKVGLTPHSGIARFQKEIQNLSTATIPLGGASFDTLMDSLKQTERLTGESAINLIGNNISSILAEIEDDFQEFVDAQPSAQTTTDISTEDSKAALKYIDTELSKRDYTAEDAADQSNSLDLTFAILSRYINDAEEIVRNAPRSIKTAVAIFIRKNSAAIIISTFFWAISMITTNQQRTINNYNSYNISIFEIHDRAPLSKKQLFYSKKYLKQQNLHEKTRIVEVNSPLNVRLKPNKKSATIGKLPPRAVVTVSAKANRYYKVEFYDPRNDCAIIGWVASKYLSKI